MLRLLLVLLTLVFSQTNSFSAKAAGMQASTGPVQVMQMADGLNQPWALGFLPHGAFLVSERGGKLWHFDKAGMRQNVGGIPKVVARGQGGLLDVMIPRDFATSREVFLSFSKRQGLGSGTALGVGTLSKDGSQLIDFKVIFQMNRGSSSGRHFGSRIVEAPDGRLFLTIGERGDQQAAQDIGRHEGSVIRLNRDGSVPVDNPFVAAAKSGARSGSGAAPEIWSYGHRNPQGAALDHNGQLWLNEHGAQGGDEVNKVVRGQNYGWPVISYGRHYSGAKIGVGSHKDSMRQPEHYWDPSIAPSGMMIYSGKLWPEWQGNFFVGSLKFDHIARLDPQNGFAEEKLQSGQTTRLRDIREAPDGSIWFLSAGEGAVFRLSPG